MSFFSARISIQWPPEALSEPSTTMVSSTPSGKFVDLRPLRNPQTEEEKKFPFEWAILGYSTLLGDNKMQFSHTMDSRPVNEKLKCLQAGTPYKETEDIPDIGLFSNLDNGDRKEDGEMLNISTGKVQPYVEIWRTIDGDLTTPDALVRLSSLKDNNTIHYKLYEISNDEFEGRYITIGKWGQGILNRKNLQDYNSIDSSISCIRTYEGQPVISYGIDVSQFPVTSDKNWKILESN